MARTVNHVGRSSGSGEGGVQPSATTRLGAALGLFVLAPLVGEFLLGNLPITWLWVLPTLAALYGGGALLIRETARRFRLGWPGVVVLGLTYAVVEEAFVTQSLFNPDYLGLRLLDYGYVPEFGIGLWWTVFVLGIHTVWSTAVPIALTESFVPGIRHRPWLGPVGLGAAAVVFVVGCVASYVFGQQEPFTAPSPQLVGSALVVVVLLVGAFGLPRLELGRLLGRGRLPGARAVGGTYFVLGSAFMSLAVAHDAVPAGLNVAAMVALVVLGGVLLLRWAGRPEWTVQHGLAASAGLLLTYCWFGFVQVPSTGDTSPTVDLVGNAAFAGGAVVLLVLAWRRVDGAGIGLR